MNTPEPGDLKARLERHLRDRTPPGLLSAYLYGSRAEGRSHRESDLDVGVLLDREPYPTARDRFDARVRLIAERRRSRGSET